MKEVLVFENMTWENNLLIFVFSISGSNVLTHVELRPKTNKKEGAGRGKGDRRKGENGEDNIEEEGV